MVSFSFLVINMMMISQKIVVLVSLLLNSIYCEPIPPGSQIILGGSSFGNEQYLIELSPGETRWVSEREKWALRRVSSLTQYFVSHS